MVILGVCDKCYVSFIYWLMVFGVKKRESFFFLVGGISGGFEEGWVGFYCMVVLWFLDLVVDVRGLLKVF